MAPASDDRPLLIVGGGRMGEAILGGLIAVRPSRRDVRRRRGLAAAPRGAGGARIRASRSSPRRSPRRARCSPSSRATSPQSAKAAAAAGCDRILSVAAGVTTKAIEAAVGEPLPVVRAMPNTPALVGAGAAAISAGAHAGEGDLAWAEEILSAVGVVVRVPEKQLDAVTGVSGLRPGVRLPRRGGPGRGGRARGPAARRRGDARVPDAAGLGAAARRGRREPRGAEGRGHLPRRHDRRRAA